MKKWLFEPGHSSAEFRARHMMVTNVRGHFKNVTGSLQFDPDEPADGSVRAEIDAGSIWTGDTDRDDHLKHDDFLGVDTYPTITFEGDTVESQGCNELLVHGELTIRDVTREVTLDARYLGKQETSYWADGEDHGPVDRIGFTATTRINRHDFNVSWQSELPGGGVVVGDTVWITLDVEALPATFLQEQG